jgi:hypothetical protein
MCEGCTRREFLGTSALAGALLAGGYGTVSANAEARAPGTAAGRQSTVRIAVIFAGQPVTGRGWSLCETDPPAIEKRLHEIEDVLGNVKFIIGQAGNAEQSSALLEEAGPGAPVLAIITSLGGLLGAMPPVLEAGRPTAVFAIPGSGHDWMYPPRWQREGHRVTLLPSSDLAELERAARLLRVVPLMQQSRVLLFPPARGTEASGVPGQVKERLGADLVLVGQERFDEVMAAVDEAAVAAETDRWIGEAERVAGPAREDVRKAARVDLALSRLMEEEQADALAVGTCMGWLQRGFPCLGFTRLRDRGIPAACEGDMDSLWTMLLIQHAFNVPGFQGNNYFDTARNGLWTAHCTGPLRMDGPGGPAAPYLLRGHSEVGGEGAVPEVRYRVGQEITRAKLINLDTILVSTGTIVEVPGESFRACRTQALTEVKDAAHMAFNWGGGVLEGDMMTLLHRVLFYGDHQQSLQHLAHLMGMRVVAGGLTLRPRQGKDNEGVHTHGQRAAVSWKTVTAPAPRTTLWCGYPHARGFHAHRVSSILRADLGLDSGAVLRNRHPLHFRICARDNSSEDLWLRRRLLKRCRKEVNERHYHPRAAMGAHFLHAGDGHPRTHSLRR